MDPRATHLRQMSRDLGKRIGQPQWFEMSERIEALVKAEKKLNPNVDFYSASTYHALGIPIALFTPIFAVSRCAGWTAHVLEQLSNNRLDPPARRVHRSDRPAAVGADGGSVERRRAGVPTEVGPYAVSVRRTSAVSVRGHQRPAPGRLRRRLS